MSHISKVLSLLIEKPIEVSEDDFMEFGEDYGVSINKKLYARAVGVGMSNDIIAKLAKAKGKTLEDVIKEKETKEKDDKEYKSIVKNLLN